MVSTPSYTPPPPDPGLTLLEQQATQQQLQAAQTQSQQATATMMQQYGVRSILAGAPVSLANSSAPTTFSPVGMIAQAVASTNPAIASNSTIMSSLGKA